MSRDYFLSSLTRPIDALHLVTNLLGQSGSEVDGIIGGFQYIRARRKLIGTDSHLDALATRLVHEANCMVSAWIQRNRRIYKTLKMALNARYVVDAYARCPLSFGADFEECRLICYFNLAELHRGDGEILKCTRLLDVCEVVAETVSSQSHVFLKVPSTQVVQTCLSEMLLSGGEPLRSADKSKKVLNFFRLKGYDALCDSEWTTFMHALFAYSRSCIQLHDLGGVAECGSLCKQARLQCTNTELLDRVEAECRKHRSGLRPKSAPNLVNNWREIANEFDKFLKSPEIPKSPQRVFLGTQTCRDVYRVTLSVVKTSACFALSQSSDTCGKPVRLSRQTTDTTSTTCKTGLLALQTTERVECLPSNPLRTLTLQTLLAINCSCVVAFGLATQTTRPIVLVSTCEEWVPFTSTSCGKEYFYNRTTGESVWRAPP